MLIYSITQKWGVGWGRGSGGGDMHRNWSDGIKKVRCRVGWGGVGWMGTFVDAV